MNHLLILLQGKVIILSAARVAPHHTKIFINSETLAEVLLFVSDKIDSRA